MSDTVAQTLTKMNISDLRLGQVPFDMYVIDPQTGEPRLYCRRGDIISEANVQRLRARRIETVLARASDLAAYHKRLAHGGEGSVQDRFHAIRELRAITFDRLFGHGSTDAIFNTAQDLAAEVIDAISCHTGLRFSNLYALMAHDNGTFTHCMNVCVYSISLAREMGIDDEYELLQVGVGGLLHDLGKRHISREAINKPGTLTREERRAMQSHPVLGFREMATRDDMLWGAMMMIYQHHERCDGSGYPVGVTSDEIHPFAKICSVVDVFHAMTSERPYRKPLPPLEACSFLWRQTGTGLDRDIVSLWISGFTG